MNQASKAILIAALICAHALLGNPVQAEPIVPRDDAQVIETLLGLSGERAEERKMRRALAQRPGDAALATRLSARYLERARANADPRYAGLAFAALQPWANDNQAPSEVLLLQATLEQHVHRFDSAGAKLERLVELEPSHTQAWLTLATIRRVQARYADSDRACRQVLAFGERLHGAACLAENDGLRGRTAAARATFEQLLATPRLDAATRNWLATSLAELEERDGRVDAAQAAWARALAARPAPYSILAYTDFLIQHSRHQQAMALLAEQPRTDAVVLRIAMAATLSGASGAAQSAREMRERFAAADLRLQTQAQHGREQAMFALWVDKQPGRAFELARANLRMQAEPIDLLVLAQAARAWGDAAALHEAQRLRQGLGLHDRRVDALL
jgi:hypothetical protein